MDKENQIQKPAGPADYLANERTFLAWIRTSIALMGFGFVIVKFAVFIQQVSFLVGQKIVLPQGRESAFVGMVMVVAGALVAAFAFFRYNHIEKQLRLNKFFPTKWLTIAVTLCLLASSVLLVLYLLPSL